MNPPSSSTSSSEPAAPAAARPARHDGLRTALWTVLFLIVLDQGLRFAFALPPSPRTPVTGLRQYFNFGLSTEAKLRYQVRGDDASSDPVAHAGFLNAAELAREPTRADSGRTLVAGYGQSFTFGTLDDLARFDSSMVIRHVGGPSSPPSHSYAAYLMDRDRHTAKVVVLGIVGSTVRGMHGMSGTTWGFDRPYPFTYPRYSLDRDGQLVAETPVLRSLADLRRALYEDPALWQRHLDQMARHDDFYQPFTFRQSPLDQSVIVRLIRRSWAEHHRNAIIHKMHPPRGFDTTDVEIPVLRAMVREFAASARHDGRVPVVLLLQDRGFADHLYRVLEGVLRADDIPYVSTHEKASARDLNNFVADGHFTPAAYRRIATALDRVIRDRLARAP